jgi:hypothetical protein
MAILTDNQSKKRGFYNLEFVAKIKESRKQVKQGKVTYLKTSDLWR